MDKRSPGKDGPEEVTRESLISIAYSKPEGVLSFKSSSKNLTRTVLPDGADCDEADRFRSELIALSYKHAPDTNGLSPALAG